MATGFHTVNYINKILNYFRATNITAPTNVYIQLHTSTGDPGAAGTANVSAVTTRSIATWAAPSGGAIALTGTLPSWSMTTTETLGYISAWDAATVGNVQFSGALASARAVQNGDTFTLNTCAISFTPLMA
jgi:hypothetical protein